jgi:hypothetical protein
MATRTDQRLASDRDHSQATPRPISLPADPTGSAPAASLDAEPLCALCGERRGVVSERWGEPLVCAPCFLAVKGHAAP